ncbi:MAG TPA: DUF559 domain-containing protein [Nocardioides sp.]|nr:DUF559 domain-containing protein [Nocardioides sp.]
MEIDDFPQRPFHVRELGSLGLTCRRVELARADGLLRRVTRGVYVRADLSDTHESRACALALAISANHVAVDRTAATLLGLEVVTWAEHDLLPPIETCALRGRNPTHRPEARGRSRDLVPTDITEVRGVKVTTPIRTALDLGCNLRRREALASMIGLARAYGFTADDLGRELPRFKRRRGVRQLRGLVSLVDPRIESPREAWTWLEIIDAGLPEPTPQVWILVEGVPTYRLDFAWERLRVCIEYDGWEAHERTPEQRAYDAARRRWLRDNGWTVIVLRSGDFTGDAVARWISELRAALRPSYSNRRW